MDIHPCGSRPTRIGPDSTFTGQVLIDPIIQAPEPARLSALRVSFAPGARTHWHHHVLGQTLHVVAGTGRIQERGGPLREIKAGDTVWIPPGIEHWHGASPGTAMTHIAMQEAEGGEATIWLEPVSDEDAAREPVR